MIQLLNEVGSAMCKAELCPPAAAAVTVSSQKQSQTVPAQGRMKRKMNSSYYLKGNISSSFVQTQMVLTTL